MEGDEVSVLIWLSYLLSRSWNTRKDAHLLSYVARCPFKTRRNTPIPGQIFQKPRHFPHLSLLGLSIKNKNFLPPTRPRRQACLKWEVLKGLKWFLQGRLFFQVQLLRKENFPSGAISSFPGLKMHSAAPCHRRTFHCLYLSLFVAKGITGLHRRGEKQEERWVLLTV